MYNNYYLNTTRQSLTSGGNYEIHKGTCPYYYKYRAGFNFVFLGGFITDRDALSFAKRAYPAKCSYIDGCAHCCKSINNG